MCFHLGSSWKERKGEGGVSLGSIQEVPNERGVRKLLLWFDLRETEIEIEIETWVEHYVSGFYSIVLSFSSTNPLYTWLAMSNAFASFYFPYMYIVHPWADLISVEKVKSNLRWRQRQDPFWSLVIVMGSYAKKVTSGLRCVGKN